jgi:hypothetical protein
MLPRMPTAHAAFSVVAESSSPCATSSRGSPKRLRPLNAPGDQQREPSNIAAFPDADAKSAIVPPTLTAEGTGHWSTHEFRCVYTTLIGMGVELTITQQPPSSTSSRRRPA